MIRSTISCGLLLALLLLAPAASAGMYKCKNSDGSFSYGDQPCTGTAREQSTTVKAAPAPVAKPAPASSTAGTKRNGNVEYCDFLDRQLYSLEEAEAMAISDGMYGNKKGSYAEFKRYEENKLYVEGERNRLNKERKFHNCSGN
ncbi:DUF4124 domain-containing protein [Chitinilyticum piscinae]|uniref:DUF4124 domain-containing protein n=1 Tax=Chitinilyticum piscinae TaxID=2866724 RepID=A0A8J7KE92_9NEIS|nr:DUF4124 domain-containing protein [Chitinilyticum piscinae]MBE9609234.1 DUF4124 domain-containing protein [Chitinilyticum piscinae]